MKKSPPFRRLYDEIAYTESGCWEWQGQIGSSGYGQIKAFGKTVSCHRLSYELYNGQIPQDKEVMHTCHNRICINPDHLLLGTHQQNMEDASKNKSWKHVKRVGVKGINKSCSKQVVVLGKPYGSINESERILNLSHGTVDYWLKNVPEKAKVITKEEYLKLIGE